MLSRRQITEAVGLWVGVTVTLAIIAEAVVAAGAAAVVVMLSAEVTLLYCRRKSCSGGN